MSLSVTGFQEEGLLVRMPEGVGTALSVFRHHCDYESSESVPTFSIMTSRTVGICALMCFLRQINPQGLYPLSG